jgi:hypothetical protein
LRRSCAAKVKNLREEVRDTCAWRIGKAPMHVILRVENTGKVVSLCAVGRIDLRLRRLVCGDGFVQ